METVVSSKPLWWIKDKKRTDDIEIPELDLTPKNSHVLEQHDDFDEAESDIGSIIEEINKIAARSPLGPYEKDTRERSVEDIMKEAEQIFMESSKSFDQLSARSKTSANLSASFNDVTVASLNSASPSPLPLDNLGEKEEINNEYSDDFTDDENSAGKLELVLPDMSLIQKDEVEKLWENPVIEGDVGVDLYKEIPKEFSKASPKITLNSRTPIVDTELEKALENFKDAKESNNALQLQLDNLNQTYQLLKISHDKSIESNDKLNSRLSEYESLIERYKDELETTRNQLGKLLETETNLNKLLEIEKLQLKSSKSQNEKDARCILDLNRQVKEMERIVARKHPDSVSALIVAAKNDETDNLTTKRFLEERVKSLENEAVLRDQHSSKLFLEVQEKFAEMKNKYESHIEDLELHVNDLKSQLKQKADTFEIYTQTLLDDDRDIPVKETKNVSCQTSYVTQRSMQPVKRVEKEDTHLLATIRGLQADLANKDKAVSKLQKELDETRKTIKRLQKEREGNLRCLPNKEFRSYPEKLANAASALASCNNCKQVEDLEEELRLSKSDRDKIKKQLCKIEEDYQTLKSKRLYDLSALQQAHENEIATYINNITPLQKQLEIQQSTIGLLEQQLNLTKLKTLETCNSALKQTEEGSYQTSNINSSRTQGQKNPACGQCTIRQQQLITYKRELDQLLESVQSLT